MSKSAWKQEVLDRECRKCKICGSTKQLTVHHKLPKARKGKGNLANCVCWCSICHRAFHKAWGLTESDDFGNPIGEYRRVKTTKKKKHRR